MYKSLVVFPKLTEASQSQEAPIKIPSPNLGIETNRLVNKLILPKNRRELLARLEVFNEST